MDVQMNNTFARQPEECAGKAWHELGIKDFHRAKSPDESNFLAVN